MSRPEVVDRVAALRAGRVPFVHATVVLADRPTSAKPGDEAIVFPDGTIEGFVGGTCAESTVRAQSLTLTCVCMGATLRIEDSLRAGRSRFYAEIARIRETLDLATGTDPLLFLFDELFQGTNSKDRAEAAAKVLRTFVDRQAIGLVTTHDLALTRLVEELGGRAINMHFEDRFDRGELIFDYRLRSGPATRGRPGSCSPGTPTVT